MTGPEHHVTREGRVIVVNAAGVEHLLGWVDKQRNGWRALRPGGFTVGFALGTRRQAVEALMRAVYGEDDE